MTELWLIALRERTQDGEPSPADDVAELLKRHDAYRARVAEIEGITNSMTSRAVAVPTALKPTESGGGGQ